MKVPADNKPFLGVRFDCFSTRDAEAKLGEIHAEGRFAYVVTPNVDHMVQLHRRPPGDTLWTAYDEADLCLCDSRILQLLANWSNWPLPLAPGSDLTELLIATRPAWLERATVIGGDAGMVTTLRAEFPEIHWQHYEPPMGVRTNPAAQEAIAEYVEANPADIIFFAIGAPQSELLCRLLKERDGSRGVALCIGASLEFVTGRKKRAPKWMRTLKLEWLFRLSEEPRRLARRYLIDGPRIFAIWFCWLANRRLDGASGSSSSAGL